jgi:hypothetical protein
MGTPDVAEPHTTEKKILLIKKKKKTPGRWGLIEKVFV